MHKALAAQIVGSCFSVSPEVCCFCVCALYVFYIYTPGLREKRRGMETEIKSGRENVSWSFPQLSAEALGLHPYACGMCMCTCV